MSICLPPRCCSWLPAMAVVLALAPVSFAQLSGGPYTVYPVSVDGGGGASTGGAYSMMGIVSQQGDTTPGSGGVYQFYDGYGPASLKAPGVQWVSLATHGSGVGLLGIDLDATRTGTYSTGPISEPRRISTSPKFRIVFDNTILRALDGALDTGEVTVTDSDEGSHPAQSINFENSQTSGRTLTLNYASAFGDETRYTLDIASRFVSPTGLTPDTSTCQVRFLIGDVNSDGYVDLIDVGAVKTYNRLGADSTRVRYDVNIDGNVNLIDAALTRSKHDNEMP